MTIPTAFAAGLAGDAPAGVAGHPAEHEFGGLDATQCSWDCTPDRCVITHRAFCGHPCKGAMQPALMVDPEAVRRHSRARKVVAMEIARLKADRGDM